MFFLSVYAVLDEGVFFALSESVEVKESDVAGFEKLLVCRRWINKRSLGIVSEREFGDFGEVGSVGDCFRRCVIRVAIVCNGGGKERGVFILVE